MTRIYEREEMSPALRRILDEARTSLDLPFVPSIFKILAGQPDYLRAIWDDLAPVLRSKEFHFATKALTEQVRLLAIDGGWRLPDQLEMLASQNLSGTELALFSGITGTFARALPQMVLLTRLLQRGYHGGQRGNVTEVFTPSVFSHLIEFHVPPEKSGGLRVWLIYSDIRRRTGVHTIPSVYRMLSAFPGYLASVWLQTRRLLEQPAIEQAIEIASIRASSLVEGLPVRDHRALTSKIAPAAWRDIEETVDGFARTLPQFAVTTMIWHRSFPASARLVTAA